LCIAYSAICITVINWPKKYLAAAEFHFPADFRPAEFIFQRNHFFSAAAAKFGGWQVCVMGNVRLLIVFHLVFNNNNEHGGAG